MDQRAEPDFPRQAAPAGPNPGMDMPGPTFRQPGQIQVGVPDARQRVLALQTFDGKELYHGLGS